MNISMGMTLINTWKWFMLSRIHTYHILSIMMLVMIHDPEDHFIQDSELDLEGTYYENTFPGIWGVVLGLWCYHTHTNFEMSPYMLFWARYAFLKVPRRHLPNERVSFGTYSYIWSGHICILPPTSPPPSNQSIDTILWTSGRGLGADVSAF